MSKVIYLSDYRKLASYQDKAITERNEKIESIGRDERIKISLSQINSLITTIKARSNNK